MAKATKTKEAKAKKGGDSSSKFKTNFGGDAKEIQKEFKSANNGKVLRIGENEEYTIAFLTDPTEWGRVQEHNISAGKGSWAYIPCTDGCMVCSRLPNENARMCAFIPIYVYDNKKVQYYRAPSTVMTDLMLLYERYGQKGFVGYDWILTRIDSDGPVRYDLDRQMSKVKKSIREKVADIPDLYEVLEQRLQQGLENMNWLGKKNDKNDAKESKRKTYEENNDDLNMDDIADMDKEELIELIDDYNLKGIADPEEIKLKTLRQIVSKKMDKKLK